MDDRVLALVPIGVPFGFPALEKTDDLKLAEAAWLSLSIGAFLTLLPAITALIIYMAWRPWQLVLDSWGGALFRRAGAASSAYGKGSSGMRDCAF